MGAHLDRAIFLYQRSRFGEMQKELHDELAAEPENARAHAYLALCLLKQDKIDGAKAAVGEAVRLAPDMGWVHYVRGYVLLQAARSSEFTARFMAALFHHPITLERGYVEAEAAVREALRLDPAPRAFYFELLAAILQEQGRAAEALEAAEQGLKVDPQDADCMLWRAKLLEELKRLQEAGEAYRAALVRAPENAAAHRRYGLLLLDERKPDQALEHLREALRLDPNSQQELRPLIVAALKRRHLAYRLASGYLGWLDRLGLVGQTAVVAVGVGAVGYIPTLAAHVPALDVPLSVLQVLFMVFFCFLAPAADPLFNLALRFNRFGRLVLSRDNVQVANWVVVCLAAAAAAFGTWLTGPRDAFPISTVIPLLAILVIKEIYQEHTGRWRVALLAATAAVIGAAMAGRLVFVIDGLRPLGNGPNEVAGVLIEGCFGCIVVLFLFSEAVGFARRCRYQRNRRVVQAYGVVMVGGAAAAFLWVFRWDLRIWQPTWPNPGFWPAMVSLAAALWCYLAAVRLAHPRVAARKAT